MFITMTTLTTKIAPAPTAAPAAVKAVKVTEVSEAVTDIATTMTTTTTTTTKIKKQENIFDTSTTTTEKTTTCTRTLKTSALTSAPASRTTITSDPGILCFHHCNVKVFCFTLPHICPNCKVKFDTTEEDEANADAHGHAHGNAHANMSGDEHAKEDEDVNEMGNCTSSGRCHIDGNVVGTTKILLPFRLPYPFVRASQYPCAIVLRPTTGDFLNDYNNATDLHIAVTTSTGTVVEFDRHGLRQHRTENMPEWWQCLLVGDVPEPWYDYWDEILLQCCKQTTHWSTQAYQEDSHNCYTFVLTFLQALAYDKLSEAAHSKTTFCEKYIVPRTTTAGKYISLYRKLRDTSDGIYVHPHVSKQQKQKHQQQQQRTKQIHQRCKARSGCIPSTLTALDTAKKTMPKATNSTTSTIAPRSPTTLCTIEE